MDWSHIPNPDPAFHYCWLTELDRHNFQVQQLSRGGRPGYKIVAGKTRNDTIELAEKLGFPDQWVSSKNRINYAEMVLCTLPIEEHHKREAEKLAEAAYISSPKALREQYEAAMEGNPVAKPIVEQLGETIDRDNFNKRENKPFVSLAKPSAKTSGTKTVHT